MPAAGNAALHRPPCDSGGGAYREVWDPQRPVAPDLWGDLRKACFLDFTSVGLLQVAVLTCREPGRNYWGARVSRKSTRHPIMGVQLVSCPKFRDFRIVPSAPDFGAHVSEFLNVSAFYGGFRHNVTISTRKVLQTHHIKKAKHESYNT